MPKKKLPYLNIGCGARYHKDWLNIDIVANSADVMEYNLIKGLPFENQSFEVVYHSHVLEHIPRGEVNNFIRDCYRVLKDNGILRIAFPDLENIARYYLQTLEQAIDHPNDQHDARYQWMLLELLDQMVRNESGGEMKKYLEKKLLPDKEFVLNRCGTEAAHIINQADAPPKTLYQKIEKFRKLSFRSKWNLIRTWLIDSLITKVILWSNARKAYQIGSFRMRGEIHQWMYDRYSISTLLKAHGFKNVRVVDAFTSDIPGWDSYSLDGENGKTHKPDSLFIEATR